MAEIITTVNKYPEGISPKGLATILQMDNRQIRKYLRRAYEQGRIANSERGFVYPCHHGTSVTLPLPE